MKSYVTQLIEDLHQVTTKKNTPLGLWEVAEAHGHHEYDPEDRSYVNDYLYGERQPISVITTIAKEQLPPVKKLSIEQQALLASELENFLKHFNFYLDFPHGFPPHLRYPFIRNIWEDEHIDRMMGETHLEFCDYEEENCPFPGYCTFCDNTKDRGPALQSLHDNENEKGDEQDKFEQEDHSSRKEHLDELPDNQKSKIDLNAIPVPVLCTICKTNQMDPWDDHLLCLLSRYDQRNKKEFECGSFDNE